MPLRFNIALAIAPALGLLWLFQRWDAKRPEPPGQVRNVVLFGMAVCIPAAIIELIASAMLGPLEMEMGGLPKAFIVAAATEETLKLVVVLVYLWRRAHFDEVMDGILYTAAASLGFALLENVLYAANNPILAILRAFTAVPMHAVCSGIMGYFVGRAKLTRGTGIGWLLPGLAIAVFIHGMYDWIVFSGGGFGIFEPDTLRGILLVLPVVGLCGLVLYALVRHAHKIDDEHLGSHPRPLQPAQPPPMMPALPGAMPFGAPRSAYDQPGYGPAPAGWGGAPGWGPQNAIPPGYPAQGYAPAAPPPPGPMPYAPPPHWPEGAPAPPYAAPPQPPAAHRPPEAVSPFAATQWDAMAPNLPPDPNSPPKGWPSGSGNR
jgi:hypothetical protein